VRAISFAGRGLRGMSNTTGHGVVERKLCRREKGSKIVT
jgi:hypothetical protein